MVDISLEQLEDLFSSEHYEAWVAQNPGQGSDFSGVKVSLTAEEFEKFLDEQNNAGVVISKQEHLISAMLNGILISVFEAERGELDEEIEKERGEAQAFERYKDNEYPVARRMYDGPVQKAERLKRRHELLGRLVQHLTTLRDYHNKMLGDTPWTDVSLD